MSATGTGGSLATNLHTNSPRRSMGTSPWTGAGMRRGLAKDKNRVAIMGHHIGRTQKMEMHCEGTRGGTVWFSLQVSYRPRTDLGLVSTAEIAAAESAVSYNTPLSMNILCTLCNLFGHRRRDMHRRTISGSGQVQKNWPGMNKEAKQLPMPTCAENYSFTIPNST